MNRACTHVHDTFGVSQTLDETFFTSSRSLHDAVIKNDTRRLETLISTGRKDINEVDSSGYSALLYARSQEAVDLLVSAGADKQAVTKEGRRNLLHRACGSGTLEFVHYLIYRQRILDTPDKEGKYALDLARDRGRDDIVSLFSQSIDKNGRHDGHKTRSVNVT